MNDTPAPATPRLAATVLLIRDEPLEVLMVRRAARDGDQFSATLVFPGGVVDPEDRDPVWDELVAGDTGLDAVERALRIAACRETFEEVGILLADGATADCSVADPRFDTVLRAAGLRLPLDRLVPFGHWITPAGLRRRFDTHFYLCRAPDGAAPVCDGRETVAFEWITPAAALVHAEQAGRVPFPTRMNLRRLAESADVETALAAARARPAFTVQPVASRRGDTVVVTIPEAAGYGVTEDVRSGPSRP